MANAKLTEHDSLPKSGRVNEVCREWTVREDGAFAYRLQNQEINEHYTGNKYRNAQVREDFPCALDEQLREQKLAEQAAAVYHQMLAEQEEIDTQVARELTEKLEHEEKLKRKAIELHDANVALQLIQKDNVNVSKPVFLNYHNSPQRPSSLPLYGTETYNSYHAEANYKISTPRRQGLAMPLPPANNKNVLSEQNHEPYPCHAEYSEPYQSCEQLEDHFKRIEISNENLLVDQVTQRKIQEEKDAELARQLQEQETASEDFQFTRDRLLAIEAQDKELAKLLQERERIKAKKAKERAKQRALAKRQQQLEQEHGSNQLMPDDSYSSPVDLLPQRSFNTHIAQQNAQKYIQNRHEEDVNYSFPVDVLPGKSSYSYNLKQNYSPQKGHDPRYNHDRVMNEITGPEKVINGEFLPTRPTQLSLNRINKPRYPDPESIDICESGTQSNTSPSQHVNIAMAIDPTYPRRSLQSPPTYDTSSSTVTTSTSSSSPGMTLPTPDFPEHDEETSPVPPYMPIQGQRRTASLEKKQKKKAKDSCKQQ